MKHSKIIIVLLIVMSTIAFADIPREISYQGILTEDGTPMVGDYEITFQLYNSESGGSSYWSESHYVEIDSSGLYNVMLGSISEFPEYVDFSEGYWLGVSIDGYPEFEPRYKLGTSPYAFRAIYADTSNLATVAMSVDWVYIDGTPSDILDGDDYMGGELAGGDLSGEYPEPEVVALRGVRVSEEMPVTGQVLKYNGAFWEPNTDIAGSGGAGTLNELTDVNVPSPSVGQVIKFNGTSWVASEDFVGDSAFVSPLSEVLMSGNSAGINNINMNDNAITNIDWLSSDDGSGSMLDADLLDGESGSYYLDWFNLEDVPSDIVDGDDVDDADNIVGNETVVSLDFNSTTRRLTLEQTGGTPSFTVEIPGGTGSGASLLSELGDVDITTPDAGQVLKFNGSEWVASEDFVGDSAFVSPLSEVLMSGNSAGINDINMNNNAITNIDWLFSDNGSGSELDADLLDGEHGTYYLDWDNLTDVPSDLTDGDDVDDADNTVGNEVITSVDFNSTSRILAIEQNAGTAFFEVEIPGGSGSGATTLDGLTDVNASSPGVGQVIKFNGSEWVASDDFVGDSAMVSPLSEVLMAGNTAGINDIDLNNNALLNIDWSSSDDGSGSYLDADLLDGENGDYYLDWENFIGIPSDLDDGDDINDADHVIGNETVTSLSFNPVSRDLTLEQDAGTSPITVNIPGGTGGGTLGSLSDVDTSGLADTFVLKWISASGNWQPRPDVGGGTGDNWGTQVVQSNSTLSGDGTAGDPLRITTNGIVGELIDFTDVTLADFTNDAGFLTSEVDDLSDNNLGELGNVNVLGATPDQVLTYNGTNWVASTVSGGTGADSDWSYGSGSGDTGHVYHSGKVSIGTTAEGPLSTDMLLIDGNILPAYHDFCHLGSDSLHFNSIYLSNAINCTDGSAWLSFNSDGGYEFFLDLDADYDPCFFEVKSRDADDAFVVTLDGDVGIGTDEPEEKLSVAGDIAPTVTDAFGLGTPYFHWQDLYLSSAIYNNYYDNSLNLAANGGVIINIDYDDDGLGTSGLNADFNVRCPGIYDALVVKYDDGYVGLSNDDPDAQLHAIDGNQVARLNHDFTTSSGMITTTWETCVNGDNNSQDARGMLGVKTESSFGGLTSYFGTHGLAYASGSYSSYGMFGEAKGSGGNSNYGGYGTAYNATYNYGLYGLANDSYGTQNYGVYGYASGGTTNVSVLGQADAEEIAVGGYQGSYTISTYWDPAASFAGVTGVMGYTEASTGVGVYGMADHSISEYTAIYGVRGDASSIGLNYAVMGDASFGRSNYGVYGFAGSPDGGESYGVYASGDMGASGSKSAIVRTADGPKALYCQESPENWFEDFGEASVSRGRSVVYIAEDYLETVTIDSEHRMQVFITPYGNLGEYWIERKDDSFILHAPEASDDAEFGYRIVAKRKGYEDLRLKSIPSAYGDRNLYPHRSDVPAQYQYYWDSLHFPDED